MPTTPSLKTAFAKAKKASLRTATAVNFITISGVDLATKTLSSPQHPIPVYSQQGGFVQMTMRVLCGVAVALVLVDLPNSDETKRGPLARFARSITDSVSNHPNLITLSAFISSVSLATTASGQPQAFYAWAFITAATLGASALHKDIATSDSSRVR